MPQDRAAAVSELRDALRVPWVLLAAAMAAIVVIFALFLH
jgi:type VI protein secretion system component VasF